MADRVVNIETDKKGKQKFEVYDVPGEKEHTQIVEEMLDPKTPARST